MLRGLRGEGSPYEIMLRSAMHDYVIYVQRYSSNLKSKTKTASGSASATGSDSDRNIPTADLSDSCLPPEGECSHWLWQTLYLTTLYISMLS